MNQCIKHIVDKLKEKTKKKQIKVMMRIKNKIIQKFKSIKVIHPNKLRKEVKKRSCKNKFSKL